MWETGGGEDTSATNFIFRHRENNPHLLKWFTKTGLFTDFIRGDSIESIMPLYRYSFLSIAINTMITSFSNQLKPVISKRWTISALFTDIRSSQHSNSQIENFLKIFNLRMLTFCLR